MSRKGRLWIPVDLRLIVDNRWDLDDHEVMAYLRLLAYAKEHETDGLVPLRAARSRAAEQLPALLEAQLVTAGSRYVQIVDWLKWHSSSEERESQRIAARERMRRHRAKSHSALRTKNLTTTETETGTNAFVRANRTRTPVDNPVDNDSPVGRWMQ